MSLYDTASFDLKTPQGQKKAIEGLYANHNDVFERSTNTVSYKVVAYVQLNINLIDGDPTGVYTATYNHGLGYPPQVLAFGIVGVGYSPIQYQEIPFDSGVDFSYKYYSVDKQNLVFKVFTRNLGGFFITPHYAAAFYIFNLPLNNLS